MHREPVHAAGAIPANHRKEKDMMSVEQMNAMSDEAADRAKKKGTVPKVFGTFICESKARVEDQMHGIPFIGSYKPHGWKKIKRSDLVLPDSISQSRIDSTNAFGDENIMVDASGWGGKQEPALTKDELVDLISVNPDVGFAILEHGQFQAILGLFKKEQ